MKSVSLATLAALYSPALFLVLVLVIAGAAA